MAAFVGNTNVLRLNALRDELTEAFINDATVTVTVKTDVDGAPGVNVVGETWPLTMDYFSGSDGIYEAFLDSDLAFVAGSNYWAVIEVDAGVNRVGHWEFRFKPTIRKT